MGLDPVLTAQRRAGTFIYGRSPAIGWGTWIRTKTNRVRVCCATVTPFPNGFPSSFKRLAGCPAVVRERWLVPNHRAAHGDLLPTCERPWQARKSPETRGIHE